jgi:hypothetical protein
MTEPDLIVIAEFDARPQADLLRAHLESSGIEAHVTADDIGGAFPGVGTAKVWVSSDDEDAARAIAAGSQASD